MAIGCRYACNDSSKLLIFCRLQPPPTFASNLSEADLSAAMRGACKAELELQATEDTELLITSLTAQQVRTTLHLYFLNSWLDVCLTLSWSGQIKRSCDIITANRATALAYRAARLGLHTQAQQPPAPSLSLPRPTASYTIPFDLSETDQRKGAGSALLHRAQYDTEKLLQVKVRQPVARRNKSAAAATCEWADCLPPVLLQPRAHRAL